MSGSGTLPAFEPGSVWLVGAGPGDPGLLTLLAAKALQEADAVVHDALVGPAILAMTRPGAVTIDVGKRAGRPSPKQSEINDRLVELARLGWRVLRLKGGDPFVFGRGGEEALALAEAGVPFRVVPGVTAGIGGLASASIPVTHRGMTNVVSFVTGHDRSGGLPADVDWNALASGSPVIVLYMALRTIEEVAARLIEAGRSPMTPVAVVSNATTDSQTVIETNLARCGRDVRRLNAKSPAIIAIGDVVRLRAVLSAWQQTGSYPYSGTVAAAGGQVSG